MKDNQIAVIEIQSKQYIVEEGSRFALDRIDPKTLPEVLLFHDGNKTLIGEPALKDVGVHMEILEEKKDRKIAVRRYKSKSRYRKNKGHRQPISVIHIIKIGTEVKTKVDLKLVEVKEEKTKSDKVKTENKESKATPLINLDISDSLQKKLEEGGYKSVEDIKKASKEDLIAIKGVGEKAVDKLLSQVK